MTPKVPYVTDADHQQLCTRLSAQFLSVKDLEAEPAPDHMNAVLMTLEVLEPNTKPLRFALSPPAASQLARALRRAVKDYLSGNLESESRSEEDQD